MEEKNPPLLADEIIAGLGKRKLKENIKVMIRILSDKALDNEEFAECLKKEPEYKHEEVNGKRIQRLVGPLRHLKISGWQDGEYFIKGSRADPRFQDNGVKSPIISKSRKKEGRSLRSIIYEILKQAGPMPAGRLALKIIRHPDYDGSYGKDKKLKTGIGNILGVGKNGCFFEKAGRRHKYTYWRVKDGSNPPPWKRGHLCYRKSAIYQLMRTKAIIAGWSYRELFEELDRLKSGYISLVVARVALGEIFRRDKAGYFEKIPGILSLRRRAKWLGQIKIPATASDFKDLTIKVLTDLAAPLSREDLAKAIHRYGDLFGYQTNELPLALLESKIIQTLAGTMYATLVL